VSTVTTGGEMWMGAQISGGALTVDVSVSPDGTMVALAHAGTVDPGTVDTSTSSTSGFGTPLVQTGGQVTVMNVATTEGQIPNSPNCTTPEMSMGVAGQVTSVAFNPNQDPATTSRQRAWLVAQSREPARLIFFTNASTQEQTVTELGGPTMLDTGHEIFHRDAGSGIACAQCHAEGGEDGRVWKFTLTGDRRTQALHVGLAGTEPFHWDGDLTDLHALMDQVFVGRMGGPKENPEREGALKDWLNGLKPPSSIVDASSAEAIRGKALFESAGVGCSSCHSGDKHTNNTNQYVGTTELSHTLQVPSLVGIAYRAPFLHNGCAATLRDRFDPACGGGDLHGKTSGLTEQQLGDLIAYLETL
jgi:hypothetical protein